ncbi:MAG: P-loop NTPase [Betaproteobacteria bacterium]|nr:P-loop NTPase [Betaproteobacteria bacterium]
MKTYRDIVGDGGSDIAGQVARRQARMRARMAAVASTLAVMSGKGGVGKSAVTANLAAALAMRGHRIGVLDADINGPCMARMLGVEGQALTLGAGGVTPAVGPLGMKVVSMDLLLAPDAAPVEWDAPAPPQPHVWRGAIEAAALQEFFTDTVWGTLDFLLVDLPPGPERFPGLHSLLPRCDGAIVVTIPSGMALLTVKRSIASAHSLKVKLLGVVENMSSYLCPRCGAPQPLFRDEGDAGRQALGASILGRIPFDPRIARCCDQGVPFVLAHRQTQAGRAFMDIAAQVSGLRIAQEEGR